MKKLFALLLLGSSLHAPAQLFQMKKSYTGCHYQFSNFETSGINLFVTQFNSLWKNELETGFSQYTGGEMQQTYTTSGFRVIFGKKEEYKWTASTDYAYGGGKHRNRAYFTNGAMQEMLFRVHSNRISTSFGIALKENTVWFEAMYCTNITKIILEYGTEYPNGAMSYGTEYKLNGLYIGQLTTMELGFQASYKYKKSVLYGRAFVPLAVTGPDNRSFVDNRSSQNAPKDFPSEYNSYVNDPQAHINNNSSLQSTGFKGFSYGFGMIYIIGKEK